MRQLKITKQITDRQTDSINKYFQDIGKYKLITADEEVELTRRIREGDIAALEKLTTANLRFVVSVAKQYQNQGLSLADLINEGNHGLVKAAYKFDETRGFKYISYAVWWIRQAIIQAIAEQSRVVRLPLNKVASINKVAKAASKLEQKYRREPTDEEIANHAEISKEEVYISNRIKNHHISFDAPLKADDNNDKNLYDIVITKNLPPPDANLIFDSLKKEINIALKGISKIEAEIIRMFYGLNGLAPLSLGEIGLNYGLSRERVRQIKEKGLMKLRKNPYNKTLKSFLNIET
jgi:RNA polymerase primary sigma factor